MHKLLDEIAQTALALLYTYHHVDVRVKAPTRKEIQEAADQLRVVQKGLNTPMALISAQNQTLDSIKNEINDLKAERGATLLAHVSDNLLTYSGSEIDLDTVAITAHETTLYMACNFKIRRNKAISTMKSINQFDYSNFNRVDPAVFSAIATDIWKILDEQPRQRLGKTRAKRVDSIKFISTIVEATDANQSAAPHAEMQIISYLYAKNMSFFDLYMGVSKSCCKKCSIILDALTVQYNDQHENTVKNWFHPKALSTTAMISVPRET